MYIAYPQEVLTKVGLGNTYDNLGHNRHKIATGPIIWEQEIKMLSNQKH